MGVITTNRICKACTTELCDRKLETDMLLLGNGEYDVILGMNCLSKYHTVIDYRNKKVIFRIPYQPEFQFFRECKPTKKKNQLDYVTAEVKKKGAPVWDEFLDAFEEILGLSPDRVVKIFINIISKTAHLQSTIPDGTY